MNYYMNTIFLLKTYLVKGVSHMTYSWFACIPAFFLAFVGLEVLEQFSLLAKVMAAFVTLFLSILTFVVSRKEKQVALQKMKTEIEHLKEDQLLQVIEKLRNLGWINDESTTSDVEDAVIRFRNLNKL